MSIADAFFERFRATYQEVVAERDTAIFHFYQAYVARVQRRKESVKPTNHGYLGYMQHPVAGGNNWTAAFKLRRHYENETERRKAAGKYII